MIDQSGTLLDPTASPAIMTDGLLDRLGISPFDVCLMDDSPMATPKRKHLWRLGKGGAGTLEAYLDDVTATVEASWRHGGAGDRQGSQEEGDDPDRDAADR